MVSSVAAYARIKPTKNKTYRYGVCEICDVLAEQEMMSCVEFLCQLELVVAHETVVDHGHELFL